MVEAIQKIAANHARVSLDSEENLLMFLRSWWSKTFQKPLKDPLLYSYTMEELLYEFFIRSERDDAKNEKAQSETDRIEDDAYQNDLDWAAEEERKDAEELAAKEEAKWMQDQIDKAKEDDEEFGDDVDMTF